ncbi:MAG TPA: hypothetical protein DC005_05445 [Proteobacteria bacterium]|nr:hypothetical protein [Pseudomonadota bacterium]
MLRLLDIALVTGLGVVAALAGGVVAPLGGGVAMAGAFFLTPIAGMFEGMVSGGWAGMVAGMAGGMAAGRLRGRDRGRDRCGRGARPPSTFTISTGAWVGYRGKGHRGPRRRGPRLGSPATPLRPDHPGLGAALGGGEALVFEQIAGRTLFGPVGTGADIALLPPGHAITGVDIAPAMLARARPRAACYPGTITLLEADLTALPFGDGAFDTALAV